MDLLDRVAPTSNSKTRSARKTPRKVPKPSAKAAEAKTIHLSPLNDGDIEMVDNGESEVIEKLASTTTFRATLLREFESDLKRHQGLKSLPDPGSLEPVKRCDTCHDTGKVWTCTVEGCEMDVCIQQNGAGCIKLLDETLKPKDFVCPRCLRAQRKPMPYKTESYIHHHMHLQHTTNPLWAAFMSLGNESTYGEDLLSRCLLEHFVHEEENLHIVKRLIKLGNNRPSAILSDVGWIEKSKFLSDIFLYINTHADSGTGNLVMGGGRNQRQSGTIHQLIFSYFGEAFVRALAETEALVREGYTIVRGITLVSCGPSVRFHASFTRLRVLVEESLFDFILAFGGSGTIEVLVAPALMRFVENVYIYCMDPWTALLRSFGEDQNALDSTSVALIWAEYQEVDGLRRRSHVHAKMLSLANHMRRPFGIDFWRCDNCKEGMQYLKFNSQGTIHYGNEWTKTKVRYACSNCGHNKRDIRCPGWIKAVGSGLDKRAEFPWPLRFEQLSELGIQDAQPSY